MQLEIRPDPTEVGRARRWARSRLAGLGIAADEPLAETLILLVSELVTNAVVHTGHAAVLRLSLPSTAADLPGAAADLPGAAADLPSTAAEPPDTPCATAEPAGTAEAPPAPAAATVRVEVADSSSRAPVPRCAGGDATGGRGLALVDCLADRWGWSPEGAGKSIWCELDRCSPPRESAGMAYGGGLSAYEGLAFEAV
ncbi:histidine kinase-like protein [Streptomyces puniciscabiei]|uniref:Histidine kinase-like protein n=1 Tax=Streptomyces puniciscabiei TaxID=164348 RepID=A0A542UGT9_9ACTN|nr:ATP-binding protein [Streptomyces puniciscabiei]TQK98282.1 histidine kinase-like protein [Streptomyces puniciscabiei]